MPAIEPREACVMQAAAHYGAQPDLIRSVLRAENGRVGKIRRNKNGSIDMGPMQVNSIHLPELAAYGITKERLINDECLNIFIGTYYLQKQIVTARDASTPEGFWRAVGNYRSKTPEFNVEYQYSVWNHLQAIRGGAR